MTRTPVPSHYDILRLDRRASPQRVRLAYRRMAQKFHPDKHLGRAEAAAVMAHVNLAYAVLSDPPQRAAYDAWLEQQAPGARPDGTGARATAFVQDRIGWAGWLLLAIASITVLTLGFVTTKLLVPPKPAFRAPSAAMSQAPVADGTPLAPVQPIQPWVEQPRRTRPVNEETEPVARLVRDGVLPMQRQRDSAKSP